VHLGIFDSVKIQQMMRFGHKADLEHPLHVSQRGEGDAHSSTLALADRRR
jgi:hypothetical protein